MRMSDQKYCSVPVPKGVSARAMRFLLSPRVGDLPIPYGRLRSDNWPPILYEIAEHIGDREALIICDIFAGSDVYVTSKAETSPFRGVISEKSVETMAHVFGRERLQIPSAQIVERVKCYALMASAHSGVIDKSAAAKVLGMPRRHFTRAFHATDCWEGYTPTTLPEPRIIVALRRAAEIAGEALTARGAPEAEVHNITSSIMSLWFDYKLPKR